MELVTLDDVRSAAANLDGVAVRTPLLPAAWAVEMAGDHGPGLWLKPENLQPVGAFKLRGAYHAVVSLPEEQRKRGVVAHSSGNHGRALAWVAARLRIPVVVVMPDTSPKVKIAAIEALGAEIVMVPPAERLPAMERIAKERGMNIVPPFDHPAIIAGQGTVGLEIIEDFSEVEVILAPIGGGGLGSGVATAVKALRPDVRVFGVEPEDAAETAAGLRDGQLTTWPVERTYSTIADGVRTAPSELTFAHLRERLDGIVTVTDAQIEATVGLLARESKIVAEPTGAVAPAAYLFRGHELPPGRTVAIVSGGNLEPALLADLITR